MTIQDLGALGEFLGLFLVLASLVYLGVQTRQARQVAATETARAVVADFRAVWEGLVVDPHLPDIMRTGINDWASLDPTSQLRAHSFLCNVTTHFVAASKARHVGELSDFLQGWEDNVLGVLQTPGGATWWQDAQHLFDPDVVAVLNGRLAKPDTLPLPWTAMRWWQVLA